MSSTQIDYTTIRDIQRNYKKISEDVNKENRSLIVMSNNRPQFVVVSLKTFSNMQHTQSSEQGLSLLGLIDWADTHDLGLPSDLSEKHDAYLWGKPEGK